MEKKTKTPKIKKKKKKAENNKTILQTHFPALKKELYPPFSLIFHLITLYSQNNIIIIGRAYEGCFRIL